MDVKFVEATNGGNWGKFMIGRYTDSEWREPVMMPGCEEHFEIGDEIWTRPLVASQGWTRDKHVWVMDLATGEGAMFALGGFAHADLEKHKIHVCVLFEAFLAWLYDWSNQLGTDWWNPLPRLIMLPDVEFALYGRRRPGPTTTEGSPDGTDTSSPAPVRTDEPAGTPG